MAIGSGLGDFFSYITGAGNPAQQAFFGDIGGNLRGAFTSAPYRQSAAASTPSRMPKDYRLENMKPTAATRGAADTGEVNRFQNLAKQDAAVRAARTQPPVTGGGMGGGATGGSATSGVTSMFAPLFKALDQQRKNAESRYSANAGQIKNIYGQLIGARTADIGDIETAYNRLQEAAATRGAATLEGMQGREDTRFSQNEAVLQSMGVGDIGTSAGDIASQSSAVAQDVEALNQSNWAGMLDTMGATAQEIARADITGFGYRQGEDIARLQASKENYLQDVTAQEFDLKFQQEQAKLQAQQAAAAARASAANAAALAQQQAARDAAKAQQGQYDDFLKYSDPLTQSLVTAQSAGVLTPAQAATATEAYNAFMSNVFAAKPPSGQLQWNGPSASAAFLTSPAAEGLNQWQKSIIRQAINASF